MKRIALFIITLFVCVICRADTFTQYWYVEDNTPIQTSCTTGGDIILPTPPTKYGYDFIGWEKLPIQRIEYLESTGTQYIDTGVRQSDYYKNLIMSAKFQFVSTNTDAWVAACVAGEQYYLPLAIYLGHFMTNLGAGGTEIKYKPIDENVHTIIANSAESFAIFDGKRYTINSNIANIPYNIYMFGRNEAGSTRYSRVKIYNLSFSTNNGIKIRDFIPVLDSDGVPCMLDRIEGKFYYNAGTGDFIAGPVIGSGE